MNAIGIDVSKGKVQLLYFALMVRLWFRLLMLLTPEVI